MKYFTKLTEKPIDPIVKWLRGNVFLILIPLKLCGFEVL